MYEVRASAVMGLAVCAGLFLQVRTAAAADVTVPFSVASPTRVPGALLKPGAYTIQLLDHLSDRTVVRLDSVSGSTHITFLGVSAAGSSGEAPHAVEWPEKVTGHHALRGFVFPGGQSVEFVYPKADAVAVANSNGAGVVAIDPASEGRPELSKLTNTDMTMVNLWMLTPVRVGPNNSQKGIEAKRYQAPAVATATGATTPRTALPTTTASASAGQRSGATPAASMVARAEPPARPVAARRARPIVSQLPKTNSFLPLIWLGAVVSTAGASALRWRRSRLA